MTDFDRIPTRVVKLPKSWSFVLASVRARLQQSRQLQQRLQDFPQVTILRGPRHHIPVVLLGIPGGWETVMEPWHIAAFSCQRSIRVARGFLKEQWSL